MIENDSFAAPALDDWEKQDNVLCSICTLILLWCVTLMFVAWFQQRASERFEWGVKQGSQGGTRFRIVEAQSWTLAQNKYLSEGTKSGPLRIESGPSWRACFWFLHFVRCAEALQVTVWRLYINSIRGRNLELERPVFACLIFLDFFGLNDRQK